MDRGHRPLLGPWPWRGAVAVLLLPWTVGEGHAQGLGATPPPAVSATPWVQASPPPVFSATPKPAATTAVSPQASRPPKASKPTRPTPTPGGALPAGPSVSPDELTRDLMRRRAEEPRPDAIKAADQRVPGGPNAAPYGPGARNEPMRPDQLPPEERAAFQRNLPMWRQLPMEERQFIRQQARERMRQEVDQAYQESGLNLSREQREMFNLRYRQERRRLERELQDQINAERARRLLGLTERLRQEFGGRPTPPFPVTPFPAPSMAEPPPATTNPDALLVPRSGFRR